MNKEINYTVDISGKIITVSGIITEIITEQNLIKTKIAVETFEDALLMSYVFRGQMSKIEVAPDTNEFLKYFVYIYK